MFGRSESAPTFLLPFILCIIGRMISAPTLWNAEGGVPYSLLSDLCFLRSAFHFNEKLEVFVHFLLQSVYLGTFAVHQFIVAVDFFLGYLLGKSVYLRL